MRLNRYLELRALHYIHHLGDMRSNLAMVNMGVDGLFHTLAIKVVCTHPHSAARARMHVSVPHSHSLDDSLACARTYSLVLGSSSRKAAFGEERGK